MGEQNHDESMTVRFDKQLELIQSSSSSTGLFSMIAAQAHSCEKEEVFMASS